jgi:glucose-1-phosphatase
VASISNINLIMIDLGGVLFEIDFRRTVDAFLNLPGYNGKEILFGVDNQHPLFVQADLGFVTRQEFCTQLRQEFGFIASDSDIIDAWCAILIAPYPNLPRLPKNIPAVLVSNISAFHYHAIEHSAQSIFSMFDAWYLSFETHLRKPNPEFFLHVCKQHEVAPQHCLLIDDSLANCTAAHALGMHVQQHVPGTPVVIDRIAMQ